MSTAWITALTVGSCIKSCCFAEALTQMEADDTIGLSAILGSFAVGERPLFCTPELVNNGSVKLWMEAICSGERVPRVAKLGRSGCWWAMSPVKTLVWVAPVREEIDQNLLDNLIL